jgi:hypothetical protein
MAAKNMTVEHKDALAAGRSEGRAVRAYLEALESHKPKRGRKRTPESIEARLTRIGEEMPTTDPLSRLLMAQETVDLQAELSAMVGGGSVDLVELEDGFVKVAGVYAARKGISYAAFRQVGVPAAVLKRAGIGRAG